MAGDPKVIDFAPVIPATFSFDHAEAQNLTEQPLLMSATFEPGLELAAHYHPSQIERYEIVSGTLDISMDGTWNQYGPGDSCEIPTGMVHSARNTGTAPVQVSNELEPGLRAQAFLEQIARLISEGKITSTTGLRSGIYTSLVLMEYRDVTVSSSPPDVVVRVLARIGKTLGYQI
jgi:quercetin dioxygenase-like cupin family protein